MSIYNFKRLPRQSEHHGLPRNDRLILRDFQEQRTVTKFSIQDQQKTSFLAGGSGYLEELYEQYLKDPLTVSDHWRHYFSTLRGNGQEVPHSEIRAYFEDLARRPTMSVQTTSSDVSHERKQVQIVELVENYRTFGHLRAHLDPLGLAGYPPTNELELSYYGLSSSDMSLKFNSVGLLPGASATLEEIYNTLVRTYCGTIGFEYKYISDNKQINWLQQQIESVQGYPVYSPDLKKRILTSLTAAEGLERYLGTKYVGQTRFSVEGGDSMMPMLDEIIQRSTLHGVKEIVIGMGHRGRLNVLINTMGKSPDELIQEFDGKSSTMKERSGDVKYHMGFASDVETDNGPIHLALAFNPSHLEIIDPVVEGSVRARQYRRNDIERTQVVPLLLHGDAAYAGQGVVMETMQLSQTRGFGVGGTIHVVVNNQIGFTTSNPLDSRSTWYCTDIAKMFEAPVFHVNADDPEAVHFVAQLAVDFRNLFKKDVVIDLVCYRRHGHNEGDEPSATQPVMYQHIKQLPTVRKIYADRLIAEGIVDQATVDNLATQYRDKLDAGKPLLKTLNGKNFDKFAVDWKQYRSQKWTAPAKTGVPLKTLKMLAEKIETLPSGMVLQPQVAKMMDERRKMTQGEMPLNWGYAETMAYATLLNEGYPIRMSGQDCKRGTFAHRHAALYDFNNGKVYIPLEQVATGHAKFVIVDSLLSEEAVLAFEYGCSSASPNALIIWEAQYGDFVNGAQVVIDQFISSGEQKWGRLCGLTMFLPHGYEGAGPEHSSARLERFLQLCAEDNMQVCVPTTPAQIFHLLRRQMIRPYRKPLIVLTPKSLLRAKLAVSSLSDLAEGEFQNIIPEIDSDVKANSVERVILCSGKVYYDLLEQRRAAKKNNIAIVRMEQLYPFPAEILTEELQRYKKAKEVIWCQEEPQNQGAWYSIVHAIKECLAKGQTLRYVGRAASASSAAGVKALHVEQQKALITEALR